jgi:hypothetical protein
LTLVADVSLFFGSGVGNVDFISLDVTYTVPGDITWYTVSSGGISIGTGASFTPVGVAGSPLANTNTPGVTTFYAECSNVAGCRMPAIFTINPLPVVSFTGLNATYCGTTAAILLTGNYAPSRAFTGAGIADNGNGTATFNPANAAVGINAIVYSYTDGNTCVNTDSQNVTIIAPTIYYADADGDGFGNAAVTDLSCSGPSVGFVANNTDCDDNDITKNTTFLFYVDADRDEYGTGSLVSVCAVDAITSPVNYSINNTDCNDGDVLVYQNGSLFIDADND